MAKTTKPAKKPPASKRAPTKRGSSTVGHSPDKGEAGCSTQPPATKTGRPTDYEEEHCDAVIALGRAGKSLTVMAAELDVSRETIYEWARVHPAFSDALTRARVLSQAWWENTGQSAMFLPGFNASVWSRSMAARFPDEWRESVKSEHSGPNGGPIQTATVDVAGLSVDQLRVLSSIPVRSGE